MGLKELGILSGITKGTLQGLQISRQREREQEERERQERNRKIDFYKQYLPDMSKEDAEGYLSRDETLGDDDKQALMGIAGLRKQQKQTLDPVFQKADEFGQAGGDPQKIFEKLDQIITVSSNTDETKENARRILRQKLGIREPEPKMPYKDFIAQWQDPEIDREGLKRRAIEQGTPEYLDYAGKTGRNPRRPSTPSSGNTRTEEEVIDDQARIIQRRSSVLKSKLENINKQIPEYQDSPEQLNKLEKAKAEIQAEYDHLLDRESELAQPDAKPFKDLKKALTVPKKTPKSPASKIEDVYGSKDILQMKAIKMLEENGYKPTAERIKKLIDEGLVQ